MATAVGCHVKDCLRVLGQVFLTSSANSTAETAGPAPCRGRQASSELMAEVVLAAFNGSIDIMALNERLD